jgi:hypothetical protein
VQERIAIDAQTIEAPASADKPSEKQCRKVFVGGIPQSIDHNELYKLFNKISKVKKAWLQMFHADKENETISDTAGKRHRGFGFVIFSEARAVDQLLGEEFAKFISVGDDLRLEVKRAIGKTSASTTTQECTQAVIDCTQQELRGIVSPAASLQEEKVACPISLASAVTSPPYATPLVARGPAYMQWQCCGQAKNLPCVPPFPFTETPSQVLVTHTPKRQAQSLPDILFDKFLGQKPQSSEELARVLQQAMPSSYDD